MSATIPIQNGQRWTYVGPNGRKAMHTVIEATPHHVITYSDPFPEKDAGGESWMGSPSTFQPVFRRANSCE